MRIRSRSAGTARLRVTLLAMAMATAMAMTTTAAQAVVVWDESVSGDLSNSGLAPTALALSPGSNVVRGMTGRAAPPTALSTATTSASPCPAATSSTR